MSVTTVELIEITANLREVLARLDGYHLIAACAFIDNAVCLIDEQIEANLENRRLAPTLPDSAFADIDAMISQIFPQ